MTSKDKVMNKINEMQKLSKSADELIREIKKVAMDEIYHLDRTTKEMISNLKREYNSTKVLTSKIRIKHDKIIALVKSHFEVDFTKRTRKFKYKEARQIACYLFRKYTGLTLSEIAEYVGLGDHTTVIHAIKKVEDIMYTDPIYRDMVKELESILLEEINVKDDNNI
jgi:chromosomal replication initiator protein